MFVRHHRVERAYYSTLNLKTKSICVVSYVKSYGVVCMLSLLQMISEVGCMSIVRQYDLIVLLATDWVAVAQRCESIIHKHLVNILSVFACYYRRDEL